VAGYCTTIAPTTRRKCGQQVGAAGVCAAGHHNTPQAGAAPALAGADVTAAAADPFAPPAGGSTRPPRQVIVGRAPDQPAGQPAGRPDPGHHNVPAATTDADAAAAGLTMQQAYTRWEQGLADHERAAVSAYAGSKFRQVNQLLRDGHDPHEFVGDAPMVEPDAGLEDTNEDLSGFGDLAAPRPPEPDPRWATAQVARDLDGALAAAQVPADTRACRWVDPGRAAGRLDWMNDALDQPDAYAGTTVTEAGFVSTSLKHDPPPRGMFALDVLVPPRTKGAYVGPSFSRLHHQEAELLLARGTRYRVVGADPATRTLKVEVLPD
jgi:hypothetical protein